MRVHWLFWLFYWLYWLSAFGLKQRWLAMTLTVTGTPVSRVGHLMCTDNTLANNYYGHWDFPGPGPPTFHLFPAGLAPWAHLTCLFKKLERCLGCTAWDVEIQSNLPEREFHCNTLPKTLQRRSAECTVQQTSWSSWCLQIWTDRVLPPRRIRDNGWIFPYIRYPATGSRSWILLWPMLY